MHESRYADLFRTEALEHLAELDASLLAYERDHDAAHVTALFRSTHSMKGMAAAMGYRAVDQLAHALESLLDRLRGGDVAPDASLVSLLFDSVDGLRASVDDAVQGRGDHLTSTVTALREQLAARSAALEATRAPFDDVFPVANAFDRHSITQDARSLAAKAADAPPTDAAMIAVAVHLTADCALKGVRALMVLMRCRGLGAVRHVSPAQDTWTSDTFDGEFVVHLSTSVDAAAIESAVRATGDVARVHIAAIAAPRASTTSTDALQTVRVDRRRLDTLLDLVGELVVTRDRLLRVAEEHITVRRAY